MATDKKKGPAEPSKLTKPPPERLQKALEADVPKLYFNSFVNFLSGADFTVLLERNGQPVAILNASFSTMKTFALKLKDLVDRLESRTDREIMLIEFVQKALEAEEERHGGDSEKPK